MTNQELMSTTGYERARMVAALSDEELTKFVFQFGADGTADGILCWVNLAVETAHRLKNARRRISALEVELYRREDRERITSRPVIDTLAAAVADFELPSDAPPGTWEHKWKAERDGGYQ